MRHPLLVALAASSLTLAVQAQDFTRYQGAWNGPFLFYVAQQDTGAQGSPEVFEGTLRIDPDGTVQGAVPDAGCTLAGSSLDYITPANASIDVVASGCRDARFNGHFVGKLILNPQLKYASIRLSSMRSMDTGTAQISAIIRH